jgi:hypothetical protein
VWAAEEEEGRAAARTRFSMVACPNIRQNTACGGLRYDMTRHNAIANIVEGVGALESCGLGWRMDLEALGARSGGGQAM